MKSKKIRTAVITVIVAVFIAVALLRLDIQPAQQKNAAPSPSDTPAGDITASTPANGSTDNTPEPAVSENTCFIEIRCDTVTDLSKVENEAVIPYIPADGTILPKTQVEFTPGDSVFDVLLKVTMQNNIQMEFREEALYSGAYIEGINYLYEFDGGGLSGWMYKVNGLFPNYGCSSYTVQAGDEIVWAYTCDLGADVGDNSTW